MTIPHLESDHIDMLALQLHDDVYGANGDLDNDQINSRLIETIHDQTGCEYVHIGVLPDGVVAQLIRSVWEYLDRKYMEEVARNRSTAI